MAGGNILGANGPRTIANAVELLGNTNVLLGSDVSLTGTINLNGGDRQISAGNGFGATQNLTLNNINLSDDGAAHSLTLAGNNGNMTVNGIISNGNASVGSLNITMQLGTVTLNGANTFSGTTTFNAGIFGNGTLAIGNDSALGTGTFMIGATSPSGGGNILITGGNRTLANPVLINPGQQATIYGSNNLTLSGVVTNFGGARRLTNDLASNKTLTLTNTLNLSADTTSQQLRLNGTGTTVLAGPVNGPGASSLQFSGTGDLILQGSNTYGFLSVQSGTALLDMSAGASLNASLSFGGLSDGTTQFSTPTFVLKGPSGGGSIALSNNIGVAGSDSKLLFDNSVGAATINDSGFNFARGAGSGVLDVSLPASGSVTIGSSALQNGVFPYVTTNSGADLTTTSGTLLTAYTGYNLYASGALQNNTATNSLINQAGATSISLATGTTNLNTLVNKGAGSIMLALNSGTALNLGTIGTVLNAPGAGTLIFGTAANAGTLVAGGSTANTTGELLFINNSADDMVVNSAIAQHGTANLTVTKSGTGRLFLNGSGTYLTAAFSSITARSSWAPPPRQARARHRPSTPAARSI